MADTTQKYRVVCGHIENTYRDVRHNALSGSNALLHELYKYIDEKGVEFDLGSAQVFVYDVDPISRLEMNARVFLWNIPLRMLQEVLIPGIVQIAQSHGCRVFATGGMDIPDPNDSEYVDWIILEVVH